MDHTLKVTIPYEAGLSDTEMLLKVTRAVTDAASTKKGWRAGGYTPDRDFSDVRDALQRNKRNQTITLTKTRSGITARRVRASPSVAIADASGALDLEAAARKFTPELTGFALSQMADKLGARKTALDTAIYGTPGLDRSMRLSAISGAGDDGAMAKVVGYEPNRGTRIDSMAAGKLKSLIQKVILDLNVDTGAERTKNAQKLLERSFRTKFTLLEQDLVDEFRLMIKAYHEVRLMNLPYIESMMVGMDGAEFPDVLLSMLAPSPDDFLQGTDAMLIIDSKNRPEEDRILFSGITDTILSLWSRILNTREKDKPVLITDKQQEVASLLSAFNNDRTKMVRAIETACRKARRRGGDFIDAFTPYPLRAVGPIPGGEKEYAKDLKELVVKAADNAISEEGPLYQLDFGTNDAKAEAIFNEMEGKGLANRIGDTEYFIVPMSMPRFSTRPIGWDRRWMVATMRIVDEYWNILYSQNGMFITDLLYLISSRAYELFNYTMDAEDLYILTLLLVGEEGVEAAKRDKAVDNAKSELEKVADEIGETLVDTVVSEVADDKKEGDEEEEADEGFDEESFEKDITAEEIEAILDTESDKDPLEGMGTGARRRARRATKFASGILPKTSGRKTKRLKTIGDMLGISGIAKGLNKEITELERKLRSRNDEFDKMKRDLDYVKLQRKKLTKNLSDARFVQKRLAKEKLAFNAKREDLEDQLKKMTSYRDAAIFNKAQREKELQALLSGQRGTIESLTSSVKDLQSQREKLQQEREILGLDLGAQFAAYDDLVTRTDDEIVNLNRTLVERDRTIEVLKEGLDEEREAIEKLTSEHSIKIDELEEELAANKISQKEFEKQLDKLESDYDKELKRTESLTKEVDQKAEELLAIEKKLLLAGEESSALTGKLTALQADYMRDMGALRASQEQEVSELAGLLRAAEEETVRVGTQLAALDAQTAEEMETVMAEIRDLEAAQEQALEQQRQTITAQADKAIDEYVEELERVKEEKREEVRKALEKAAIAESKLQSSRGLGADMMMDRIQELEDLVSQLTPEQGENIRAKDVRNLTAPIVMDQQELVRLLEKPNRTLDELKNYAKHIFYMDDVDQYKNKKALKSAIYKKYRGSRELLREIRGERRGRKARSAQAIKVTRADGSGKDLGLVTAEVMVGVNIISDIKTGIRDVFGGRSKSGQVKLQDAMNILIEELKTRASAMGATSISHFHAEPFVYGGSGSIIGLYGYGVARKGGSRKASRKGKQKNCGCGQQPCITYGQQTTSQTRKGKRKARAAEMADFLGPLGGSIGTIAVQQIRAWWQKRKGMLPATQKDIEAIKSGVQVDVDRMVNSVMALQQELNNSQTPQLTATAVAAELVQQIPPAELEQAYDILDREIPEISEEVQDLTENLEDTRPFAYWTPFGFLSIQVPNMEYEGNEFAMHYFERYTGAEGSHIEITDPADTRVIRALPKGDRGEARYVFPTDWDLWATSEDSVYEVFGNNAYAPDEYENLLYDAAERFGFTPGGRRARRYSAESKQALEVLAGTPYARLSNRQDMTAQMKQLTRETPYLMFGSNGFWTTSDSQMKEIFEEEEEGIKDVASYIQHYGSRGEVAVYNLNTNTWFPMGPPVMKNQPSERKYKGMIIKKSGKGWNVEAFDKDFKTLKGARDFISKKVSGAASANGPCPRVIGKTKCKGTVILVRGKWKCKACKAEFREA